MLYVFKHNLLITDGHVQYLFKDGINMQKRRSVQVIEVIKVQRSYIGVHPLCFT